MVVAGLRWFSNTGERGSYGGLVLSMSRNKNHSASIPPPSSTSFLYKHNASHPSSPYFPFPINNVHPSFTYFILNWIEFPVET